MPPLSMRKDSKLSYDQAIGQLPELLKSEGFGVITEIDMRETLKKKIGADIRRYKVLGACNPHFAHQALREDLDIGVLLPCNVAVYEADDGHAVVATIDPSRTMAAHDAPALTTLAAQVRSALTRVLEKIA